MDSIISSVFFSCCTLKLEMMVQLIFRKASPPWLNLLFRITRLENYRIRKVQVVLTAKYCNTMWSYLVYLLYLLSRYSSPFPEVMLHWHNLLTCTWNIRAEPPGYCGISQPKLEEKVISNIAGFCTFDYLHWKFMFIIHWLITVNTWGCDGTLRRQENQFLIVYFNHTSCMDVQ